MVKLVGTNAAMILMKELELLRGLFPGSRFATGRNGQSCWGGVVVDVFHLNLGSDTLLEVCTSMCWGVHPGRRRGTWR